MTPGSQQLEAQSRAAIKAWCDDPSVQLEYAVTGDYRWHVLTDKRFHLECYHYRIAKPKKWYRVGKDKDGRPTIIVSCATDEHIASVSKWFKEWLDERKYYD